MNNRNSRKANKLVLSRKKSGKYKEIAFEIHSELDLEVNCQPLCSAPFKIESIECFFNCQFNLQSLKL